MFFGKFDLEIKKHVEKERMSQGRLREQEEMHQELAAHGQGLDEQRMAVSYFAESETHAAFEA